MARRKDGDDPLERTRAAQARAADPARSAWVSANAGTGKTHVLTTRVLRLLVAGTAPERILCLTYTKAAAAEMAKRVFDVLAGWVALDEAALARTLNNLLGREPEDAELDRARTLFTAAIETPGGLKVQTIHAFAERLLQRFPLEAGVTPGFAILDEAEARALVREAIDTVLDEAAKAADQPLGRALMQAVRYAADDRFDEALMEALKYRAWLARPTDAGLRAFYCGRMGLNPRRKRDAIAAERAGVLSEASILALRDLLAAGSSSEMSIAADLAGAARATGAARGSALADVFLTQKGEPRGRFVTKATDQAHPHVEPQMRRAQDAFTRLTEELAAFDCVEASLALHRLAAAVAARYETAKVRRAALDFDDLIQRTGLLLASAEATAWVMHKLDAGLDHILLDESQDTSPAQWAVIEALAAEFFSGQGAREGVRTLFAVGDRKQSIYSFQGAEPAMLEAMGERFAQLARAALMPWDTVPLDLSFRTVAPVLDAVDLVFADPARTPGVGADVRHSARRSGQAGLVEIWPVEGQAEVAAADAWEPLEDASAAPPVTRLAQRIAATIGRWLDTGERLASEDRPVRPGDIIILVRKRPPFAAAMVAALKARGIPVAGADRLLLTQQIAVMDLMSLGDFLVLPEDDLALAEVLKSPIFDLTDDDLIALSFAPDAEGALKARRGTLWGSLIRAAKTEPRFAPAADTLRRWRAAADFAPPFEFFARLLDTDGVRRKLIARLGPDAADAIDEFLNLALTYDDRAPPSLAGFLHWLRLEPHVVKRDMEFGRDEVRVMTVHGAKGLEAPIVFLPDTCGGPASGRRAGPIPMATDDDAGGSGGASETEIPFAWPVKGTSGAAGVVSERDRLAAAEAAEHDRLLYVAMTRARDRLYVAGFAGRNGRPRTCWYDTIERALEGKLDPVTLADGSVVRRMSAPQAAPHEPSRAPTLAGRVASALPEWAGRKAPREPQLTVPLAPSQLAPYEADETGEPAAAPQAKTRAAPAEPAVPSPRVAAEERRFLRGTLTHALLEHLPSVAPDRRREAAVGFLARRAADLAEATRTSIVAETMALLEHPDFGPLFGPASRAEVPIVARVPRPAGARPGPALAIAGQIDRLYEGARDVLIVDFKTNRPPPRTLEGVADVYLYQLAAYRLAVGLVYPGRAVRAALLWTDGARLMEIPATLLNAYEKRLWELDPGSLDG